MTIENIITSWKNKKFKPVYWLEGEEEYYMNKLVEYAEKNILSPEESQFNLSIFYGRDANWTEVVNTCCRYPIFAERQVELVTTKKLFDNQLPEWTSEMVRSKGFSISPKAQILLVEHIGNDLNRIENEIEKLSVNLRD